MSDTWEGSEEEFDAAILKHNEGFQKYEEDYVNMTRKNEIIIEKCKSLLIRASRENQSIPEIEPAPKENRSNEAWADHEGEKLDNHSDHMAYDRNNHHPVGLSSSEVLDAAKNHLYENANSCKDCDFTVSGKMKPSKISQKLQAHRNKNHHVGSSTNNASKIFTSLGRAASNAVLHAQI